MVLVLRKQHALVYIYFSSTQCWEMATAWCTASAITTHRDLGLLTLKCLVFPVFLMHIGTLGCLRWSVWSFLSFLCTSGPWVAYVEVFGLSWLSYAHRDLGLLTLKCLVFPVFLMHIGTLGCLRWSVWSFLSFLRTSGPWVAYVEVFGLSCLSYAHRDLGLLTLKCLVFPVFLTHIGTLGCLRWSVWSFLSLLCICTVFKEWLSPVTSPLMSTTRSYPKVSFTMFSPLPRFPWLQLLGSFFQEKRTCIKGFLTTLHTFENENSCYYRYMPPKQSNSNKQHCVYRNPHQNRYNINGLNPRWTAAKIKTNTCLVKLPIQLWRRGGQTDDTWHRNKHDMKYCINGSYADDRTLQKQTTSIWPPSSPSTCAIVTTCHQKCCRILTIKYLADDKSLAPFMQLHWSQMDEQIHSNHAYLISLSFEPRKKQGRPITGMFSYSLLTDRQIEHAYYVVKTIKCLPKTMELNYRIQTAILGILWISQNQDIR